jgi:hypothetical protein
MSRRVLLLSAILVTAIFGTTFGHSAVAGVTITSFQGAWMSTATYTTGEVVTYGGASYICRVNSTNVKPTNADYWSILDAAGAQGPAGPKGATGAGALTVVDSKGTIVGTLYSYQIPILKAVY